MIQELIEITQRRKQNSDESSKLFDEEQTICQSLEGRFFRNPNYVFKLKSGRSFIRGVAIYTDPENMKIESNGWITFYDKTVEITMEEFEVEYKKALDLLRKRIYSNQ